MDQKLSASYFDAQAPAPNDIERVSIPNFESMTREDLLKINPRYRSREADEGIYTEQVKVWTDKIMDGTDGKRYDFELLADQLNAYKKRQEAGVQVLPINTDIMVGLENMLLDYVGSGKSLEATFDSTVRFDPTTASSLDRLLRDMAIPSKITPERLSAPRGTI